jgi:hypothetical protein
VCLLSIHTLCVCATSHKRPLSFVIARVIARAMPRVGSKPPGRCYECGKLGSLKNALVPCSGWKAVKHRANRSDDFLATFASRADADAVVEDSNVDPACASVHPNGCDFHVKCVKELCPDGAMRDGRLGADRSTISLTEDGRYLVRNTSARLCDPCMREYSNPGAGGWHSRVRWLA